MCYKSLSCFNCLRWLLLRRDPRSDRQHPAQSRWPARCFPPRWCRRFPPGSSQSQPATRNNHTHTTKIIQLKQRDLYFVEGNHGFRKRRLLTVSRESAPSAVNLVSPLISVPSTTASCFLTISQTFATVSGFACLLRRIALHHQ